MAVVNGYCSIAQVRAELSDDTDQLPEALLEKAVNAASRAVDDWTGRRFWQDPAPVARRFRPRSFVRVDLPDISTVDGLTVETDASGAGSWSAPWAIDTDFDLEPGDADADGGAYAWWRLVAVGAKRLPLTRRRSLRITARWGWSAVPAQVEEATILRSVALFKRKETPYGIAAFDEFGPVRIGRQDSDVIALLGPFQRVMVG